MKKNITFVFLAFLAVFFYFAFKANVVLPKDIDLGFFTIRFYSIFLVAGIFLGYFHAKRSFLDYGFSENIFENIFFGVVVFGFLGARLYHVFSAWSLYVNDPKKIFFVWHGGLSIYGAVLGAMIFLWIYSKIKIQNLETILNLYTPALLLGQMVGRLGNFFNHELFGSPTNLPWRMYIPPDFRPEKWKDFSFFHPLFLYEILGLYLIFLIVNFFKKTSKTPLFLVYLLCYNILRFFLDFLRSDDVFYEIFSFNQIINLICAVLVISFLLFYQKSKK